MKVFKSLVRQMLAILIFATVIILFWDIERVRQESETYQEYNNGWRVETNGKVTEYEMLPDKVDTDGTGQVILRRKLDTDIMNATSIGFYTSHQTIDVYIGSRQVYRLHMQPLMTSKSPGNMWNFVEVEPRDQGEEVRIVLTDCYGKEAIRIPDFYYGAKDSIILWFIRIQIVPLILSFVIFLIGVVLVVTYFSMRRTMTVSEGVLWLGMFAIPFGIWSGLECQIFTFFSDQVLLISQISFAVLKLILIPLLQFVSIIYEVREDRVIKNLCMISKLDFWITSILQLLGWADYKETVWITHLLYVVSAIYVLWLTILILREKGERSRKSKQMVVMHAICVGFVSLCALLDVCLYYFKNSMDSARFSRLGMIIYTVILAIQLLNNSVRLIRAGKQANVLRIEAETDAMTKLKNRRSFEKALYELSKQELEGYGVVVCDLNNLKCFNDTYGHSMGDYYIIVSSEMIQDIFGKYGTVYRIGGDEFSAIVKDISDEQVEGLKNEICEKLNSLSGTHIQDRMEVAVGYAQFDRALDSNLSDTMKRADESMYQTKKEMKNIARQG